MAGSSANEGLERRIRERALPQPWEAQYIAKIDVAKAAEQVSLLREASRNFGFARYLRFFGDGAFVDKGALSRLDAVGPHPAIGLHVSLLLERLGGSSIRGR